MLIQFPHFAPMITCHHILVLLLRCYHLSSHTCSFIVLSPLIITSLDSISLPNKVSKVLAHLGWRSVMIEEMDALTDNGTWDLVCLPAGKKAIGCRWVFTVKVNSMDPCSVESPPCC